MDLAKHWRQQAARYRLEGKRQRVNGAVQFPPAGGFGAWPAIASKRDA